MTVLDNADDADVAKIFSMWLSRFGTAMEQGSVAEIVDMFAEESYWKDILSFSGGYRTFGTRDDIERALGATISVAKPAKIRHALNRTRPRLVRRSAKSVIEAYFDFDTAVGSGTGFVRLLHDAADAFNPRVWILLTTLQQLTGCEEHIGEHRPTGLQYSYNFAGDNWADQRRKAWEQAGADNDVLIVGAGQAGLALAARLQQLDVKTLLVEKNSAVGDNWRKRYHSLTLHNEVWANHLPYLPFPETWPAFVPKDKLAGWLQAYAEFMELNVWTSTEFLGADYDRGAKKWSARLRRPGSDDPYVVQASHLVLASGGTSGVPHVPSLPGLDGFGGAVMHSSAFPGGAGYAGKRALVIGTGTSGHDVAQELHANGAQVTLMQRSPTCVVSLIPGGTMVYAVYSEGPPADDVDLVTAAIPFPVLQNTYQWLTKKTTELDGDLLEGLRQRGFRLDAGPDDTGFHMLFLRRGGGYYINVGCSDLIVDGKISLVQAEDLNTFTPHGIMMRDGQSRPFDLVVLATGYCDQQEGIRRTLGDPVADTVGPVWGFDDNYIMRNMWQRTAQEHLWLMGGSLLDCRLYSRFLSLLIKSELAGIALPETDLASTRYDTTGATSILGAPAPVKATV
ncbi:monooxygenase [Mycobacterium saskatchewanense]|uniref:flavin-containing monooxygenase n=1 Tax=Mycobacterium saskatchewanense TaxID=220927 RepID=UPI00138C03FA|nr:NAD(P)/FAD-dependent oxidoreductase [Mycobacterium saskatchewanense]BBX65162.1 monooxygenase [Mycobacterium saskatchewanense]